MGDPAILANFMAACKMADFSILQSCLCYDADISDEKPEGYPAWVLKCAGKVNRALFPKVYDDLANPIRKAYCAGLAYGLMRGGELKAASVIIEGLPEPTKEQRNLAWKFIHGDSTDYTQPEDGSMIPDEVLIKVAEIESKFDLLEFSEFHQGTADAARMISGENKATETTQIYTTMVVFWRVIEQLPTADALLDLIQKIHGPNVAGSDPKRIAQMARRVGKTFRAPGRPRKTTSTRKKR